MNFFLAASYKLKRRDRQFSINFSGHIFVLLTLKTDNRRISSLQFSTNLKRQTRQRRQVLITKMEAVLSLRSSHICHIVLLDSERPIQLLKHRNSRVLTKRQSCFHKDGQLFMHALVIQGTVPDLVFKLVSTLCQSTMTSLFYDAKQQRIIL